MPVVNWLDTTWDAHTGTDRRATRRIGLLHDLFLCVCVLIGYAAGQAWHCLRYLIGKRP